MGVTVTFSAILELMREGLIEIVQAEVYGPLHVRPASGGRHLSVVAEAANDAALSATADEENIAALAQPAQPDENQEWDPDSEASTQLAEPTPPEVNAVLEERPSETHNDSDDVLQTEPNDDRDATP